MEHNERITEQARGEVEDLQRTYGFEEDEALAFWHLREGGRLMVAMRRTVAMEQAEQADQEGEEIPGLARAMQDAADVETKIVQHLAALYRELGVRVLRRTFPEGWGRAGKVPPRG